MIFFSTTDFVFSTMVPGFSGFFLELGQFFSSTIIYSMSLEEREKIMIMFVQK